MVRHFTTTIRLQTGSFFWKLLYCMLWTSPGWDKRLTFFTWFHGWPFCSSGFSSTRLWGERLFLNKALLRKGIFNCWFFAHILMIFTASSAIIFNCALSQSNTEAPASDFLRSVCWAKLWGPLAIASGGTSHFIRYAIWLVRLLLAY